MLESLKKLLTPKDLSSVIVALRDKSLHSGPGGANSLAKKLETIWQIDPHTQSKHTILRRYWEVWLPIMTKFNQRVLYIDGSLVRDYMLEAKMVLH
jgi:hypothetical protein